MDAPLSPSTLFSPSRAALHTQQSRLNSLLTTYLSQHYPRGVPPYERSDAVLSALLALSTHNEKADTERALLTSAQKASLKELEERQAQRDGGIEDDIIGLVEGALSIEGADALDTLARSAVLLGLPAARANAVDIGFAAQTLQSSVEILNQQLTSVSQLNESLSQAHTSSSDLLTTIKTDPAYSIPSNLPQKTAEYTRQTKLLTRKLHESQSRLSALPRPNPTSTPSPLSSDAIADLLQREAEVEALEETVSHLESSSREFAALGNDKASARREIVRLEREVEQLREKREILYRNMVN